MNKSDTISDTITKHAECDDPALLKEIPAALSELGVQIKRVWEAADRLRDRMEPVLRPPDNRCDGLAGTMRTVPLGQDIERITIFGRQSEAILADIADRLEL